MWRMLLALLLAFLLFPPGSAVGYDSEALSQVSKAIADARLTQKPGTHPAASHVMATSSLIHTAIRRGSHPVAGGRLNLFDSDVVSAALSGWENQMAYTSYNGIGGGMSGQFQSNFPTEASARAGAFEGWTTGTIGQTYDGFAKTCAEMGRGAVSPVGSIAWTTSTTALSGAITFFETLQYVGTSMQAMNPPIYLQERTGYGWRGHGNFDIQTDMGPIRGSYKEILVADGAGPITQIHRTHITTPFGQQVRQVKIETPTTSGLEAFMVRHFPVGSYFDPSSSTVTSTIRSNMSYQTITINGMEHIYPLQATGSSIGTVWTGFEDSRVTVSNPVSSVSNPVFVQSPMPISSPVFVQTPIPSFDPGAFTIPHTSLPQTSTPNLPMPPISTPSSRN